MVHGDGQTRSVAAVYDSEQDYQIYDSIFHIDKMYYNKTGVNSGTAPDQDPDNWALLEPEATGWDSDRVYNIDDIVYIQGLRFRKITDAHGGNPILDSVNWELDNKIEPTLQYFKNAWDMLQHDFVSLGDLAYVEDTNSLWFYIGDWNEPKMRLLDRRFVAVETSYTKLHAHFPAGLFNYNQSAKVVQEDGTVTTYFSYNGLWSKTQSTYISYTNAMEVFQPMVDAKIANINVNKHTHEWSTDPLYGLSNLLNYPLGTTLTIVGETRDLVEVDSWDITLRCGDDQTPKRTSGDFIGDLKRPILTTEAGPDVDLGFDQNLAKLYGRGLISDDLKNHFYSGIINEWPGWTAARLTNDTRGTTISATDIFMSFPGVDGRWKLSASSAGVVRKTEITEGNEVTTELTSHDGEKYEITSYTGDPHTFTYYEDGALYHGCMQPYDSDQQVGNGPQPGNWYPMIDTDPITGVFLDPIPSITITREDNTPFYFFGIRGQFMQRTHKDLQGVWESALTGLDENVFTVPNVTGGYPNRIQMDIWDENGVVSTINVKLMEDAIREHDPNNVNVSVFFYEGMHYIDINNRSFHAIRNRNSDETKEVREGLKVTQVIVRFRDFISTGMGDAEWHRENWGLNSFAPIVSTESAIKVGEGTTITQQWVRTGEENSIAFKGEIETPASWTKIYEAYPYSAFKYLPGERYGYEYYRT